MDTKKFTTTIQTKSMVEQVKENIINAIIMGELKPGDQLPTETEMCELFGVSRNTIREVIKILTTYGIVYIKRPEGTFVSEGYNPNMLNPMMFGILLGKKDWKELINFRMAVDIGTLYLACRYQSEKGMREIKDVLEKFEETLHREELSVKEIAKMDNQFHLAITKMVGNEILYTINDYISKFTLPSRLKTTEENIKNDTIQNYYVIHKKIYRLLEEKNLSMIEQIIKEHYIYWENTSIDE